MTLSIIVPTRNRAQLWRSGWLLDSIAAQTSPPDELVIALDHTEDDTAAYLGQYFQTHNHPYHVTVIDVLAPRPGPNPASGIPDNCAFHAALGQLLVHLDDDLKLPPDFIRSMRLLFRGMPNAIIYPHMLFVDENGTQLPSDRGEDCRLRIAQRGRYPVHPGGLVTLPPARELHWGASWVVPASVIRAIGGHELNHCQYHNTDTRLGHRIARTGCHSYLCIDPTLFILHQGETWHARHKHDPAALRESRGPRTPQRIANGGTSFWTSSWFDSAYKVLFSLTPHTTALKSGRVRPDRNRTRSHARTSPR